MNKATLIEAAAAKAQVSKAEAAKVIEAALEAAVEAVKKGEGIQLVGYATATGAIVEIPARKVVKIKPGAKFAL